jgi:hypothetical protein
MHYCILTSFFECKKPSADKSKSLSPLQLAAASQRSERQHCNNAQIAQALQALASPSSLLDASKHMRHAAAALFKEADSSRWLASPLVPRLLSALRSLPGTCSPKEAAQVCAAAVCALNNLFAALSRPEDRDRFAVMLAGDRAACCAMLRWGVECPQASEQLPPGHGAPMAYKGQSVLMGIDGTHPFWSPRTRCMASLTMLTADLASPEVTNLLRSFEQGVTPDLVECSLGVVSEHPLSASLVDVACAVAPCWWCCWVSALLDSGTCKCR